MLCVLIQASSLVMEILEKRSNKIAYCNKLSSAMGKIGSVMMAWGIVGHEEHMMSGSVFRF